MENKITADFLNVNCLFTEIKTRTVPVFRMSAIASVAAGQCMVSFVFNNRNYSLGK